MRAYAERDGEDVELWGVTGLLHDADYERFPDMDDEENGHPRSIMAELERRDAPPEMVRAIAAHAPYLDVEPETPMERTLVAVDELCGFLVACAAVRPEGIHGLTPKSVKKKLKQPSFAAAVNREEVRARRRRARRRLRRARRLRHRRARGARRRARAARPRGAPLVRRARGPMREAYGRVLRVPHVPWLFATALLARLPYGILGLAILLFVHDQTGSFASAGAVSAAFSIAAGIGLADPRAADRRPRPDARDRRRGVVVQAAGGLALVALGLAGASTAALAAAGAVAGAAVPPISPALRGLWPGLLGDDAPALRSALALDAISLEFVFIGGPLLTAVVVAPASPAVALVPGFAVSVVGAIAVRGVAARRGAGAAAGPARFGLGPLRSPGLRRAARGALAARLRVRGDGGGAAGVRRQRGVGERRRAGHRRAGGRERGGRAPLRRCARPAARPCVRARSARSCPLGIALLAVPGLGRARCCCSRRWPARCRPAVGRAERAGGHVSPRPGTVTEAYAWVLTATVLGVAAGTAVAGAVVEAAGWREAMLVGAASAIARRSVAFAGRRDARPADLRNERLFRPTPCKRRAATRPQEVSPWRRSTRPSWHARSPRTPASPMARRRRPSRRRSSRSRTR